MKKLSPALSLSPKHPISPLFPRFFFFQFINFFYFAMEMKKNKAKLLYLRGEGEALFLLFDLWIDMI